MRAVCVFATLVAAVTAAPPAADAATVWHVGPSRTYSAPSAVAGLVSNGDTVLIDPGDYRGDVAIWRANDLTLKGNGGLARLLADGQNAEGKGIWVTKGARTTVENVYFEGARVPDQNGAGIRAEGDSITIRNSVFRDNEMGILTSNDGISDIVIEHSEFDSNGFGDGQSHNIYVGSVRSFTMRGSYSHDVSGGHQVKSRAAANRLEYNRLDDGVGNGSYTLDVPNAGDLTLIGNVIRQGPNSPNTSVISYGAENGTNPSRTVTLVNNTLVNTVVGRGTFITARSDAQLTLINTLIAGDGTLSSVTPVEQATIRTPVGFVNLAGGDERLAAGSPSDRRGRVGRHRTSAVVRASPPDPTGQSSNRRPPRRRCIRVWRAHPTTAGTAVPGLDTDPVARHPRVATATRALAWRWQFQWPARLVFRQLRRPYR